MAYVRAAMAHESREQFRVLFLDKKNQLILDEVMNQGTVDHAPVYPREVARRALEAAASAVILVHNHPSGDPHPSPDDIALTARMVQAGEVMGIDVVDHVVLADQNYFSFVESGSGVLRRPRRPTDKMDSA